MNGRDAAAPPVPPWDAMRARLEQRIAALESCGDVATAASLREALDSWWGEQLAWNAWASDLLGVHHEINNALVGVRGNAQLLLMNPAVQQPGIRERLEVVLRESGRIQEAAGRLSELKTGLGRAVSGSRAA